MSVHSCKGVARVPTMKCWKFCSKEFERIQFSEFFPSSPDSCIFWNSPRDSRQQWRFPHGVSGLAAKMIGHYSRGGSACARPWSYQGNGCFAEGPHFQNWASHRTMIFCRVCPTLHIKILPSRQAGFPVTVCIFFELSEISQSRAQDRVLLMVHRNRNYQMKCCRKPTWGRRHISAAGSIFVMTLST